MSFEFEAGTEERHKVEFSHSFWWGQTIVRVDGEIIQKYLILLYGSLLGIIFLIVTFVLFITSGFGIIVLFGLILSSIPLFISAIIYIEKFPIIFTVGEKEKHNVQIERIWKIFPLFRSRVYNIYIDNKLFKTLTLRSHLSSTKLNDELTNDDLLYVGQSVDIPSEKN